MCKTGLNGCNFTLKQLCDSLNGASLRVHCWWFLEQHEGPPSHRASGPQLRKKKKTSGTHSGEKTSANAKTLGDGPNALNPSLTRSA